MNALFDHVLKIMENEPVALTLILIILLLVYFIFRQNKLFTEQRKETAAALIAWQQETQKIMADCVSKENLNTIVGALERDRELFRQLVAREPLKEP